VTAPLPPLVRESAAPWRATRRLAIVAALFVALSTVTLLSLSGWFITAAAIAGSAGPAVARAFNYLIPSALIRLLAIVRTVARYLERLLSHRASLSTLAALRTAVFARAAIAEAQGSIYLSGGEAASLLGAEVDGLEDRFIRAPAVAGALVAGVTAVTLGALAGWAAACAIGLSLACGVWVTRLVARQMLPGRAEAATAAHARLKEDLTEYVSAAGEIAVYDMAARVTASVEDAASKHDAAARRLAEAEILVGMVLPVAAGFASAISVILATGGPALTAMAALAAAAAGEGMGALARSEIKRPTSDVLLRRLASVSTVEEVPRPAGPLVTPTVTILEHGERYDLAPGSRVSLTGPSGAGKTRLLHTLAGLRSDAPQHVLVNGQNVRETGLYRLRPSFALVPQDPMLIAGTVEDNLRIARPGLSEERLWEALEIACFADEVRSLPHGLGQWIGDAGRMLSGGQRKRLALARGLLASRPWLLLDEPTEGLDATTEASVVGALRAYIEATGCGLILVSHRVAPLSLCERSIPIGESA